MNIPSYFIPITPSRVKAPKKSALNVDKSETNENASENDALPHAAVQEKRRGADRRKRNVKPLLDTRSGRDRRYDTEKPSIDIEA